ncbi:hypothetical protein GQR58_011700 [Nymphon striatum]|nr:hypothetical protein GQR58_011700 [Nymphon striatum]
MKCPEAVSNVYCKQTDLIINIYKFTDVIISYLYHEMVKLVVGFGEGSGANILLRFAIAHPDRVLGLLLLHCTASTAGVMEVVKDKIMSRRLSSVGMNASAEQFLVFHKFGPQYENAENKEKLIQDYTEKLKTKINPKNLRRYVEAYMNRTDLTQSVDKTTYKVDTLLITGTKSSNAQATTAMLDKMDKTKVSLLRIDGVGDVLAETPEQVARSLLLFVQGIGFLKVESILHFVSFHIVTSVALPGVERQRTHSGTDHMLTGRRRTYSMEEYDIPRRRASLATQPMNATITIKEN